MWKFSTVSWRLVTFAHGYVYVFWEKKKKKTDSDYNDMKQLNPVFRPGPVRCVGATSSRLQLNSSERRVKLLSFDFMSKRRE